MFGSGPIVIRGIREFNSDLDIIARGQAWEQAKQLGTIGKSVYGTDRVSLFDGMVEILDTWRPGEWDIDELVDTADVIDGIRFVKLEKVLAWKKLRGKKKDKRDILLTETYLSREAKKA